MLRGRAGHPIGACGSSGYHRVFRGLGRVGRHRGHIGMVQTGSRIPSVSYRAVLVMLCRYGQRGAVAALTDGRVAREGRCLHCGVQHRDRGRGCGIFRAVSYCGGNRHRVVGGLLQIAQGQRGRFLSREHLVILLPLIAQNSVEVVR